MAAAAVFVLIFIHGSRRRVSAAAFCVAAVCAAVSAADRASPPSPALARLARAVGEHSAAGRSNRARAEIQCLVSGRVRYPSPGEVVFECREERVNPLSFHLSGADVPWNGAWNVRTGEMIRAVAKLEPTAPAARESQFSYQGYLFRRRIAAIGSIENLSRLNAVRPPAPPDLSERVLKRVRATEGSSVVLAGVLGQKDLLNEELNLLFRRTGTSHLIVVSGFHVGVLFLALSFVLRRSVGRSVTFLSIQPLEPLSAAFASLGAWFYLPVVGSDISILRSLVALSIFSAAKILSRDACAPRTLSVTLAAVFLIWPGAFFEAGCQLTFLAVLGLLCAGALVRVLALDALGPVRRYLASNLLYCMSAWLFTAPAVLIWFESFAPLAPLYNLWAVPVFSAFTLVIGGAGVGLFALSPALGTPLISSSVAGTEILIRGLKLCDAAAAKTSLGFLVISSAEARFTAFLIVLVLVVLLYLLSCLEPAETSGPMPEEGDRCQARA